MKIKSTMICAILTLSAAFVLFRVYHEDRVRPIAQAEINNHAAVIASSLWTLEKSSATAYLSLAADANGYERVLVTEESGKVFLVIAGPALTRIDNVLVRLKLIRPFQRRFNVVISCPTGLPEQPLPDFVRSYTTHAVPLPRALS